jgi:hypothetical protein
MNLNKFAKKFFQVNSQAGFLRLFFTFISFFLFWSFLALINSIYSPLRNFNFSLLPQIVSNNLAISLLNEMLTAYFSIFSLSILSLIIFTFILSFLTIAFLSSILDGSTSLKLDKDLLSYDAFSTPSLKYYRFPLEYSSEWKNDKSLIFPKGPLNASIEPGYALLINSFGSNKVLVNSNTDKDLNINLHYQEKVIDCFNIEPVKLEFIFDNPSKRPDRSSKLKFNLSYSYQVQDLANANDQSPINKFFEHFDSTNIRTILEKLIISEVRSAFSKVAPESKAFSSVSTIPLSENKAIDKLHVDMKPHQKKHKNFSFRIIHYPCFPAATRNRKRQMYLNPILQGKLEIDDKSVYISPPYLESVNSILLENFNNAIAYFFASNVIKLKIISIEEQEIK